MNAAVIEAARAMLRTIGNEDERLGAAADRHVIRAVAIMIADEATSEESAEESAATIAARSIDEITGSEFLKHIGFDGDLVRVSAQKKVDALKVRLQAAVDALVGVPNG